VLTVFIYLAHVAISATMPSMHTHWLFIYNVGAHLVASMSSLVSFGIAVYEATRNKKFETWAFFVIGALCLIVAFDQAWHDEHRNAEILTAEKASAVGEREFWKIQNYDKDSALRQRDALLAQNYGALIGEQATANKAQDSLTNLSLKILEIGKPLNQKFTTGMSEFDAPPKPWKHFGQWIVMSNLPKRANIFVQCDQAFTVIDASIVSGGPHFQNTTIKLDEMSWRISIPSPPITPDSPLIITTGYDEAPKNSKCSVIPQ
jgi:hypothetical protein